MQTNKVIYLIGPRRLVSQRSMSAKKGYLSCPNSARHLSQAIVITIEHEGNLKTRGTSTKLYLDNALGDTLFATNGSLQMIF
jgi:hypothetical protein